MPDRSPALARAEVLLLEDDPLLRKRVLAHLQAEGAEVSVATRVDEARRLAREIRFDCAVVDLHLPDGEALTLLREGVFSENTVIVVMTAFGGVKKAVEAMRLGAHDYLANRSRPRNSRWRSCAAGATSRRSAASSTNAPSSVRATNCFSAKASPPSAASSISCSPPIAACRVVRPPC